MIQNIESIKKQLNHSDPKIILIGCSSGGLEVLEKILFKLPKEYPLPIIICQHIAADAGHYLRHYLAKNLNMEIFEAQTEQLIQKNAIYFAPGGYHLLFEQNKTFSLDVSEKVSYCRPSIDVMFESAITVYNHNILAILLSGANVDGCAGAEKIFQIGGTVIAQTPQSAKYPTMPQSIIDTQHYHAALEPTEINNLLMAITQWIKPQKS